MNVTSAPPHGAPARTQSIWLALGLVVVYVLLAAGLGNILSGLVGDDEAVAQFALGHFIPLGIAFAVMGAFLAWSRLGGAVWRETPTPALQPRRFWLISIPVLALVIPVAQFADIPWASRPLGVILIVTAGTLMVGFGEELLVRGILLTTLRARHGEFVAMLVTSLVFAAAHIPGSIIVGSSVAEIALHFALLAASGVTYYWVRRVSGRLWVGALIHALTDWVLYLGPDIGLQTASMPNTHDSSANPVAATAQILILIATAISLISVIREDRRAAHHRVQANQHQGS